jgi:cold shock CspA family protein
MTGNTEFRIAKVVVFFSEKGFGFLAENITDASGKRVVLQHFFHITSCNFEPRTGMAVKFRVGQGKRGPAAVDVEVYEPAEIRIPGLDALAGQASSSEVGQ